MDSLPLCNLLQDGWGALCTWNKGSDQNQAIVLHCRQGGATRAPLLLQGPFPSSSIPQLRQERIPSNQHSNVVHPAQNQCGTQGQEFKVHLQKVNRLITEEKIYLVKYWQADRGKRSWTVQLATLILHPLERLTATWAPALGSTQLEEPSPVRFMQFHDPRKGPILIPSSIKPLREIQPKESSYYDLLPLR